MKEQPFWLDQLAEGLIGRFPEKEIFHLNCGLSVRGPQHIGRIRGELCIPDSVKRILEKRYAKRAIHYLTLYDMDGLKARAAKIGFSASPERQKRYVGVSLFNVPDPFGCCKSWQEHFWKDFGNSLGDFGFEVKIVKTSELYQRPEVKKIVRWILENRERVIDVVNRFRERAPWPPDYIPISPICKNCLSIEHTRALSFNLKSYTVDYSCERCGESGKTALENAKLNWRLEWILVWKALDIEFEPYGKDHAAAGGSRETCGIFSKELLNYEPPLGEWNEWVSLKIGGKNLGEMTASGFIGLTPKEWLKIAEPEILRYLYIGTRPHTALTLDLDRLPAYYDDYDKAERIYYGLERPDTEREGWNIRRAFELSQIKKIPQKISFQLHFDFAAQLVQILPEKDRLSKAVEVLTRIGQLRAKPTKLELERMAKRLQLARNWVERYAPARYKFRPLEKLTKEIADKLSVEQKKALISLGEFLERKRTDEEVWNQIRAIAAELSMPPEELFKAAYLVLLGEERGPRLVPLIQSLGRDFVVRRFKFEK